MASKKFSNQYLKYVMGFDVYDEDIDDDISQPSTNQVISQTTLGMNHSTGYEHHRVIFKCFEDNKCYEFEYQDSDTGITNLDNESEIECFEVQKKVVKKTVWIRAK